MEATQEFTVHKVGIDIQWNIIVFKSKEILTLWLNRPLWKVGNGRTESERPDVSHCNDPDRRG